MSRIKETQARLDELLLRFTEKHPDVIATRQALAELQQRRQDEISALRRGDSDAAASSGASSNPVFQSIQVALNQVDVEIAALRGDLAQHQAKAAELRQHLDTAPQVEAEFARLNRDYDVNKAQYTALLANYEKARLGEQADDAGSVRFEVVQPPTAGFRPVFPRRGLFMALVLAAALGAGAALAWFRQMLRPVAGSPRALAELTGLSVIGVVGPAFPRLARETLRGEAIRFAVGCVALLSGFAAALLLNAGGFRIVLFGMGAG
jgi:polysaccharide chain length determinant protein (PEP-CTERM system associated)